MLTVARASESGMHNRVKAAVIVSLSAWRNRSDAITPIFARCFLVAQIVAMEMILKSFAVTLIVGASLMLPFAASAQVQNAGPDGSTGGNSVGSSFTSPGPSAGAGGAAGAGASTQVQNSGPDGSTGANNVGGVAPSGAGSNAGQSAGRATQPGRTHQ